MPAIVFPTTSAPGAKPQESGGRLINAFAEQTPFGAASKVIIKRTPGLIQVAAHDTRVHTRGFFDASGTLLWALDDRLVSVASGTFAITDIGSLAGDLPITMARNNALSPQYVAVTENGCFNIFTGSPPTSFADPDLPGSPTSVCDMDGFFVWSYADGRIFASDLNTTAVNALSFTTEQGLQVRRVVRYAGRLFAFGDKWTGVYQNTGAIPFPFTREATIPRGIVGTHAIAGWEIGWANNLIWAGDDYVVYQLNGYTPIPISTDDVSRDIQTAVLAGNKNLIEAYVYMYERNAFWVLSCHGSWTWEYNFSSGEWNEKKSYGRNNWRGHKSIRIYDQWIIGDELTGQLYTSSGTYFLEGVDPLIWQVDSGVMQAFPARTVIPRAAFNITAAVGDFDFIEDPKVEISWSLNGGYSYGKPVVRRLGRPGEANNYPSVLNSGLSRGQGVRYRLVVSDPVHIGLISGTVDPQGRGATG